MEKGEAVGKVDSPGVVVAIEGNIIHSEITSEEIAIGADQKLNTEHATDSNFTEDNVPREDDLIIDNSIPCEDSCKIDDELPQSNGEDLIKANDNVMQEETVEESTDEQISHLESSQNFVESDVTEQIVEDLECIEEVVIEKINNDDTVENDLEETVEIETEMNGHDNDKCELSEDEITIKEDNENGFDDNQNDKCSVLVSRPDQSNQNFQNAILEDWDADTGAIGTDETVIIDIKNSNESDLVEYTEVQTENADISLPVEKVTDILEAKEDASNKLELITPHNGITLIQTAPNKPRLFFSTSCVSRKEVIDEILRTKTSPAILPKKDIILAMELAKHSTQGPCVENTEEQDEHDILQILEADQVGDWRGSITVPAGRGGNDLDIGHEVIIPRPLPNNRNRSAGRPRGSIGDKLKEAKRKRLEERARQRKLALEQLAKEFKERSPARKRTVKDAPNIAAVDLKRVLASTPVITGKRKRRPCYQPPGEDDPSEEDQKDHPPSAIVKTYTPKPKSSNSQTDIQTELETIAIVKKHLAGNEGTDGIVPKKTAKKVKGVVSSKKPGRELQQLLGDEGAVRMLYDAAQKGSPNDNQTNRVLKHTKKELEKKAKFVENAVLHLSGASEKALRGKRLAAAVSDDSSPLVEPLFPPDLPDATTSTPLAPVKAKKKPKPAEASRILYRHSSSESFDGSEGLRRSVSELSGIDISMDRSIPNSPTKNESISLPQRKSSRPRKVSSKLSEYVADTIIPKKLKRVEEPKEKLEPVTFSTPKTIKHHKRILKSEVATSSPAKKQEREAIVKEEARDVQVTERGALVEITLSSNNSSYQNALTEGIIHQLKDALDSASSNPSCKAILIKSKAKVFCQGIDLGVLAPGFDANSLVNSIKSLSTSLIFMEKPIIVGVRGVAVGMGVAMLPLCDVVVASEDSSFYTPYGRLGHGPEAASSFTFPRIGKALVSELIYKGSVLSADDAFQLGLISQVASSAKFDTELNQVVDSIVSQNYVALQQSKKLIFGADQQNMINALERECDALLTSWSSPECLAAVADYLASGELLSH